MKVSVWVDGGSRPHTDQLGGYGVVLKYGDCKKAISGSAQNTTNNRMELTAAVRAFKAIDKLIGTQCEVAVVSDSEYVVKGITQWVDNWKKRGWRTSSGKPVKNKDLWEQLIEVSQSHEVSWSWTRGHSDCEENNLCDELATTAIEKLRKKLGKQ